MRKHVALWGLFLLVGCVVSMSAQAVVITKKSSNSSDDNMVFNSSVAPGSNEWWNESAESFAKSILEGEEEDDVRRYRRRRDRRGVPASNESNENGKRDLTKLCPEEGKRLVETFGEEFLPNAFGRYEKLRDKAIELQQVFNEEFATPPAKDSDTYAMYCTVVRRFAKARTDYFRAHYELVHYLFLHKAGVLTTEELGELDEKPLEAKLHTKKVQGEYPSIKNLETRQGEFAAKFMPETFALHQQFKKEFEQNKMLFDELLGVYRVVESYNVSVLMGVRAKAERLASAADRLTSTYNDLYLKHRLGDKTADDLADLDQNLTKEMKDLANSLPGMLRELVAEAEEDIAREEERPRIAKRLSELWKPNEFPRRCEKMHRAVGCVEHFVNRLESQQWFRSSLDYPLEYKYAMQGMEHCVKELPVLLDEMDEIVRFVGKDDYLLGICKSQVWSHRPFGAQSMDELKTKIEGLKGKVEMLQERMQKEFGSSKSSTASKAVAKSDVKDNSDNTSDSFDDPVAVAKAAMQSLIDGDVKGYIAICSPGSIPERDLSLMEAVMSWSREKNGGSVIESAKIKKKKSTPDAVMVEIKLTKDGKHTERTLLVIKKAGKWGLVHTPFPSSKK